MLFLLRASRVRASLVVVALSFLVAPACSTVTRVHAPENLDGHGRWAVLPITNLAETAQAGERLEAMLDTVLRQRGIATLEHYPAPKQDEVNVLADDRARLEAALGWARGKRYDYAITGTIEEWRYKNGSEPDPAVGFTLTVLDVAHDKVLWSASGASVGSSYDNTSGVALRLVSKLVENMRLR